MSHVGGSHLKAGACLPSGPYRIYTARAGMLASLLALAGVLVLLTGCGISPTSSASGGKLQVVTAENFWGSIAAQVGGDHVHVTSIIANPNTDPHDYDSTPADARTVAGANYVILNGAGYDAWGQQLLDANPVSGRVELDIGKLLGKQNGDNPHFWYNPDDVTQVANQITADLKHLDAADASYFDQQNQQFLTTGLQTYHHLIDTIKQKYQGTPVGATENIFAYQAPALGLDLISPPGFMKAVSEGDEPTAEDKATFDQQVTHKFIKVFIYNKQNATPDTDALKAKAQQEGIPIVAITETLDPATDSFQAWQSAQLQALEQALAQATERR
ncbi:MAG TPA: zinc ABC transporter substrate-binding protein [Ktedonobacterales bacterium]|nr:zinc ABC transporter substrate-binding protein [Ktedonobacterales bacterium]